MDIAEQLEKLKALFDSGAITEEEYLRMKTYEINKQAIRSNPNKMPSFDHGGLRVVGASLFCFGSFFMMLGMIFAMYVSYKSGFVLLLVGAILQFGYIPFGFVSAAKERKASAWAIAGILTACILFAFVWAVIWVAMYFETH